MSTKYKIICGFVIMVALLPSLPAWLALMCKKYRMDSLNTATWRVST